MNNRYSDILVAVAGAFVLALLSGMILGALEWILSDILNWTLILIFTGIAWAVLSAVILVFSRYYFKTVINTLIRSMNVLGRTSSQIRPVHFGNNMYENIQREVSVWIDEHKKEIDKYKVLSDYRKQFVGDIAHELKTPLFSIQGYLHTLKDGALFDPEKNVAFIDKAIKNSDRLESIINDLDMIAKLEAGEIQFSSENFNLKKLIKDVFEELEQIAAKKSIRVNLYVNSKKAMIVYGDKKKIYQVCMNLVSNAVHYGREGGYVNVSLGHEGNEIHVRIEDNGIGIPEKHLVHLFDRFYRVDSSRARNKGGSGLGLSIVKHILAGMGKEVDVMSEQGKGSVFSFKLDSANEKQEG
jgi:two-component system phosphate regulon sensor histidine kinase PhoR